MIVSRNLISWVCNSVDLANNLATGRNPLQLNGSFIQCYSLTTTISTFYRFPIKEEALGLPSRRTRIQRIVFIEDSLLLTTTNTHMYSAIACLSPRAAQLLFFHLGHQDTCLECKSTDPEDICLYPS